MIFHLSITGKVGLVFYYTLFPENFLIHSPPAIDGFLLSNLPINRFHLLWQLFTPTAPISMAKFGPIIFLTKAVHLSTLFEYILCLLPLEFCIGTANGFFERIFRHLVGSLRRPLLNNPPIKRFHLS